MAISYYYPEGPMGPVCDYVTDDDLDLDARRRRIRDAIGDGRDVTYGPVDYGDIERVLDGGVPAITTRRCRVRTLADGTKEYYDCVDDFLTPIGPPIGYPLIEPEYDWPRFSADPWGLDDDFEPLTMSPNTCAPFEPDINIIPLKMYRPDGTFVEKVLTERSSPPTFAVRSGVDTYPNGVVGAIFTEVNADNLWYTNPATLAWRITQGSTQIATSVTNKGTWVQVGASNNPANGWSQFMIDYGIYPAVPLDTEQDPLLGQWQTHITTINFPTSGTYSMRIESDNFGYIKITDSAAIDAIDREIYYDSSIGWGEETISLTLAAGTYTVQTRIKNKIIGGGDLNLRISGDAAGLVGLKLKWNDNPNTAGTALSSIVVDGVTFNQTGRKGKTESILKVTAGTDYPVTINPGTGYGGSEVQSTEIGFFDLDGQDFNATLSITRFEPESQVSNTTGFWSEEGNKYAVWVNPEVCTLPCLPQSVTYLVDIPATDTYTITGGADDNFNVFLNDETSAVIGGAGGIFAGGAHTTPYSANRTLTAGQLKIVVECTNSAAGFGSCDGTTYSTVPLYRYVNSTTGDHFTGTDIAAPSGYVNEGILSHLFTSPFPDSLQIVDHEPGKPQSSYTLYGFSPSQGPQFDIGGESVATTLIYAKSNGTDVMWTDDVTEGNGDTPAYALDPTNNVNGYAFYGASSPTTIVLGEGLEPFGEAFRWDRNPGGWYLKICRGTSCITPSTVEWVPSGPHNSWSDFADTYLVYPSNNNVLKGTVHSTSYNINVPFPGNYDLKYAVDDTGTISLDGTQIVSSTYNAPSSTTYTINNLTAGPHVLTVTCENQTQTETSDDWTRNPAGIGWTLTPQASASSIAARFKNNGDLLVTGEGFGEVPLTFTSPAATGASVDWSITGNSSDSGYQIASPTKIMWDDDISGGFDENASLTISSITQIGGSNVGVTFSSDGTGIDVTGAGSADVLFDFAWSDQVSVSGRSVGSLLLLGQTFTQTPSTSGSQTATIRVSGGGSQVSYYIKDISFVQTASASNQTKTIEVDGGGLQGNTYSSSSFYTENLRADNNGQRLCLNGDCSARIDIGSLNQGVATNDVIATSLDLRPFIKKGNLIWTTRDATGYTYKEIE